MQTDQPTDLELEREQPAATTATDDPTPADAAAHAADAWSADAATASDGPAGTTAAANGALAPEELSAPHAAPPSASAPEAVAEPAIDAADAGDAPAEDAGAIAAEAATATAETPIAEAVVAEAPDAGELANPTIDATLEHAPATVSDKTAAAVGSDETGIAADAGTAEAPEAEPVADETGSEAPPADGSEHPLFAEVAAAPHKVYLLGRVRKATAAAGEGELAERLKGLEAEILEQIAQRKAAKEALCERAEALKDSTAWKATGDAYKALFEEWKQVGAAGRELDDQLWARFNEARGAFNSRRSKHFEEREQVWAANKEVKEALVAEAEALQQSTDWKATAEKIRGLQERWKAAGSAGRERDEALWGRFNAAKQVFFDARAAAWEENRKRKEALVADAEALKDSTDWRTTGDAMKAMQAEWKTIGPAGREHEDALWTRFRAATQAFFDRRGSTFAERSKNERENLARKQEIAERAEALAYSGDALAAAREAKELQAQWKETGPVPREQSDALWARFRGACDKIFEHASGERDRQQNEWHMRMREALGRKREQLNALRESITHDEANIERWRSTLSTLQPGGKAEEIGKGLEDKIIDVMNRIRDKQARVEDLRASINDIEAKLRE